MQPFFSDNTLAIGNTPLVKLNCVAALKCILAEYRTLQAPGQNI
jgi:hypothetical protein